MVYSTRARDPSTNRLPIEFIAFVNRVRVVNGADFMSESIGFMNSETPPPDDFSMLRKRPVTVDKSERVEEPAQEIKPEPAKTYTPPRRSTMKWRSVRLSLAGFLCVGATVAGTMAGSMYRHLNKSGKIQVLNLFKGITHFEPMREYQIEKQLPPEKQASINLLMLGCDVDYENDRPVILKNSRGRSDSIMVARLDFTNKRVSVLSIPRDTAVHIPDHGINKINAANAIEGPELTQQVIKDTFGIDTDYYVSINFETFKKIVDKIGGVNLTVEKKLDYDDDWGHLHIHLKPGYQHLNGYQAMGYVRIRHSDDDLHRAARQHAFLEAMRSEVASVSTINKVPDLLNTVSDDVHSSLTIAQIISIANWVRSIPKENVIMETMPSFEGYSYVTVNTPKAEQVIKRLFFNNLTAMAINAPAMSQVEALTARGKKHKHDGKPDAGTTPSKMKGTDEPLVPTDDFVPAAADPKPGDDVQKPVGTPDPSNNGNGKQTDGGKSTTGGQGDGKSDPITIPKDKSGN